jgi:hypothetical protein
VDSVSHHTGDILDTHTHTHTAQARGHPATSELANEEHATAKHTITTARKRAGGRGPLPDATPSWKFTHCNVRASSGPPPALPPRRQVLTDTRPMRRPAGDCGVPHDDLRHATRHGPACAGKRPAPGTAHGGIVIAAAKEAAAAAAAAAAASASVAAPGGPAGPRSASDRPEAPGPARAALAAASDPTAGAADAVASAPRDARAWRHRARAKHGRTVTARSRTSSRTRAAAVQPMDPVGGDDGKRKKLFGEETAALFQQARKVARALQEERERKDREIEQQQRQQRPLGNKNFTHPSVHHDESLRPAPETREAHQIEVQGHVQRSENKAFMPQHTQPFRCAVPAHQSQLQQGGPSPRQPACACNTTRLRHSIGHSENRHEEQTGFVNDVPLALDSDGEDDGEEDDDEDEDKHEDDEFDDERELVTGHGVYTAPYSKHEESGLTADQSLERSLSDVIDAVDRHHLQPGPRRSQHDLDQLEHSPSWRSRRSSMLPKTEQDVPPGGCRASEGLMPDLHALLERDIDFETIDANELLDEALSGVPPLRRAQSDSGRTRTKVNEQFAYLAAALPPPAPGDQPPKTQGEILKRSSRYFHFLLGQRNTFNAHIAFVSRSHLRQWVRTTLGLSHAQQHVSYLEQLEITVPSPIVGPPFGILQHPQPPASQQRQPRPEATRSGSMPVVGTSATEALGATTMATAPVVGSLNTVPASSMMSPSSSSIMSQTPSLNLGDRLSLPELLERFALIYCLSRSWKYAEIWLPSVPLAMEAQLESIGVGDTLSGPASVQQLVRHSIVQNPTNSPILSAYLGKIASLQVPLSRQAGVTARVKARARPEWLRDQGDPPTDFLAHAEATSPRMRTMLGTPVLTAPGVVEAVLIFSDTDDRSYDGAELDRTTLYGNTVVQAYMEALPMHDPPLVEERHASSTGNALYADWDSGPGLCF